MIHVVTGDNQHLYGSQLNEMFNMRHEYFIDAHGWEGLESINGREVDEFDDGDVVYLLNLDADGHVAAAYRINPTIGPNLLRDKLSNYVQSEPPYSENIWDLTRWIIASRYRRSADYNTAIRIARETIIGLEEFAISRGITHLTTVCETSFKERMKRVDWRYTPLGPPTIYENGKGEAQALLIDVGPDALARTRAATGIYERQLFELKSRPIYMSAEELQTEAELELAAAQMKLAGKISAQSIVASLAEEIALRAKDDPAAAIALIHAFNDTLNDRLTQAAASSYIAATQRKPTPEAANTETVHRAMKAS